MIERLHNRRGRFGRQEPLVEYRDVVNDPEMHETLRRLDATIGHCHASYIDRDRVVLEVAAVVQAGRRRSA